MFSFGASGEKSKSKTVNNPWSQQSPYLTQGFEAAAARLNNPAGGNYQSIQDLLTQYGSQLMPGLGQAQNMYGQMMQNPGSAQLNPFAAGNEGYNDIMGNYWTEPYQMASQQMESDALERFRRSDKGDAMGASLAGQAVGPKATEYLEARALALGETENALARGNVGLRQGAMQQAQGRADSYANTFANNQQGGLAGMWGAGMQGAQMLPGAYNFGQSAQWSPLRNYWDIIGSNSWGGTSTTSGSKGSASVGFG